LSLVHEVQSQRGKRQTVKGRNYKKHRRRERERSWDRNKRRKISIREVEGNGRQIEELGERKDERESQIQKQER